MAEELPRRPRRRCVARRPSVASREKDPAAAGMRRFFSLEQRAEKKISALVVVVVVVVRLLDAVFEVVVARHLLDAVVVVVFFKGLTPSSSRQPKPSLCCMLCAFPFVESPFRSLVHVPLPFCFSEHQATPPSVYWHCFHFTIILTPTQTRPVLLCIPFCRASF